MQKYDEQIKYNSIVYGFNNSGKSLYLTSVYKSVLENNIEKIYAGYDAIDAFLIPTNRIMSSNVQTKKSSILDYLGKKIELNSFFISTLDSGEIIELIYNLKHFVLNNSNYNTFLTNSLQKIFGFEVIFNTVSKNSDGVENVINILSSIIGFLCLVNGELELKCFQLFKAVVLIDEFELYLHTSVQNKFLSFLQDTFPNITFIISTHSPLLIQRSKNFNIYSVSISNSQINLIKVEEDYYYKSLDNIYNSLFNINPYPDDFNKLLELILKPSDTLTRDDKINFQRIRSEIISKYPNLNLELNNYIVSKIED